MEFDLRTLILVIGIAHLMQVLVFSQQYKVNRNLSGPGWWLLWSISECIGFGLILFRNFAPLLTYIIIFQDTIILLGTVFVYIGVSRFFNKRENLKFIVLLYSSFVILHLFFLFVINDINARTLFFDIYISIFAFLTAFSLYKNKTAAIASTVNFNITILILHGSIFAYRTVMIILGEDVTDVFSTSLFNLAQYSDALIVGLLWTFGFIMMLNQRLNAEISEAKLRFEQIFNTSPDSAVITRMSDGLFVDCNDGFTKITGYTKEDIIGKSSIDINLYKNSNDRQKIINTIQEKGICENLELLFLLKNSDVITGLMSATPIMLNGIPHIISVTRDISDRKKMEIALLESEQKYRLLFQNLTAGFALHEIILNNEGKPSDYRFLEINTTFEMMTGLKANDLIGKTNFEVMPESESFWIDTYGKVAMTGKPITFERYSSVLHKHYQVNAYSPSPGKFATIFLDVTDQKQKEAEIHQKNEELQKLNTEKDKFFSIIAHDLRGPFSSFLGLTQIMAEDPSDLTIDEIQEIALSMQNTATNLYQLLENLLQWSMMQQKLILFNQQTIRLKALIDESIAVSLEPAKNKEIEITCEIPDEMEVIADINTLQTIIRNLVSNAIKFTRKGGKICLSAKTNPDNVIEISVHDNGIGMNQLIKDSLFRLDAKINRKGTEGEPTTGLGLLLCKEFTEKNGGKIWVESEVEKGSVFYFTIPAKV